MQNFKQILGDAVREARTKLGLSQEKLAEDLGVDTRTILNIEAGRGNPKFDVLFALITYLQIQAEPLFYPKSEIPQPNLHRLVSRLNLCTEEQAADLLPVIDSLILLVQKQH